MGYFAADHNCVGEFVQMRVTRANGISLYGDLVQTD